jgi:hypothetical protein
MNRFGVLTVLFLFGATAFSQTADKHARTMVFSTADQTPSNCPIEIRATVEVSAEGPRGLQHTDVSERSDNWQKLQITLKNSQSLAVRQSRITVYAMPTGVFALPAVLYSLGANPAELAKTFTIKRTVQAGQSNSLDLSIVDVSTVTGLSLDSLTYADGTSWQPSFRESCRAINSAAHAVLK